MLASRGNKAWHLSPNATFAARSELGEALWDHVPSNCFASGMGPVSCM
jgi:hypothetical protein